MRSLLAVICSCVFIAAQSQVKVGNNPNNINTHSLLELESTNKGLLLPRISTANMNAMAAPDGMIIYNITELTYYVRIGGNWVKLVDDNTGFKLPASKTLNNAGGYLLDLFNTAGEAGYGAIRGQSLAAGNGVSGFSAAGLGVVGSSNSGSGGYFSSSGGYALTTGTGNVGINTSSPAYLLDVNGRMRLRYNGNTPGLWLNRADNNLSSFVGQINDTTFGVFDAADNNWKFAFNHSNNHLGIGTLTPKHPVTFASTTGDKISLYGGSTSVTTNHYGLGIQGSLLQVFTPATTDDIAFGIGRSGSFTENMRVTGDGSVGIRTNAPGATLHVRRGTAVGGTAQFEGTTFSSHFNYSTNEDSYLRGGKSTSNVYINDLSTGVVGIAASGGSVGIGTNTPSQKLDVKNGRMRFTGSAPSNSPQGVEFTSFDGTSLKSFVGQKDDNTFGVYGFAGAGWAWNFNINNGNTGIGTANPQDKLHVAGGGIRVDQTTTAPIKNTLYGNAVPFAYGAVDANGALLYGYNVASASYGGFGEYTITLAKPYGTYPAVVATAQMVNQGNSPVICNAQAIYNLPCCANTTIYVSTNLFNGNPTAAPFQFVVFAEAQ